MLYQDHIRLLVCVDKDDGTTTTREPTEAEGKIITAYLDAEPRMLGVQPVPDVGDVWVRIDKGSQR